MKIVHLTPSYKPAYIYGGPIMSASKLCEAIGLLSFDSSFDSAQDDITQGGIINDDMNQRDLIRVKITNADKLDVEVFTTTANGKVELDITAGKTLIVENVPVTYFKRWTKDHTHFSPGLLFHLNKALRQAQHNNIKIVIHIHAWWNLVSVLSCLVAKWCKVSVVLSPRGMLTSYTQGNRNLFSKKIMHQIIGKSLLKYVHIHATSEQEKIEVLKIVQPKSVTVIPNLVNMSGAEQLNTQSSKFKTKRTDHISTFKLLFLSRIEEKKGLKLLFDALHNIKIDYYLTIAGTGDERYIKSLKQKAESLKLSERIEWVGQVGTQAKFELLAKHDLLVLTSYNENFANVVIESLSVGTPVLVSEQVGLADYVKENELGWVCNLNPIQIKEQILNAYQDIVKRKAIGAKAPEMIRNDFNEKVLAERYVALYERILS